MGGALNGGIVGFQRGLVIRWLVRNLSKSVELAHHWHTKFLPSRRGGLLITISRIAQANMQVLLREVGEILQDLLVGHPAGEVG